MKAQPRIAVQPIAHKRIDALAVDLWSGAAMSDDDIRALAVGAWFTYQWESYHDDIALLPGCTSCDDTPAEHAIDTLRRSWGVTDHDEALATVETLHRGMHAPLYGVVHPLVSAALRSELSYADRPDIRTDHRAFLRDVAASAGHDPRRYVDVYDTWLQARSLGACKALDPLADDIVAWDVVRAVFIIRASVTAGYLTPDEGWPLLHAGLATVQKRYATWRQMSQAYLTGFAFWHASQDLAQTAGMVSTRIDQILRLHEAPFSPWRRVALRPGTPVLTLDPSHQALRGA